MRILLVLALLLAACTTPPSDLPATETQQPATNTTIVNGSVADELEPEIAVENDYTVHMVLDEYSMTPSTITVPEGSSVRITVENVGQVAHGLGLMDFNVNEYVGPGESKTVTFVADKKGTFRFFCSVPCGSGHRTMTGTLIVE
jgi:nitrosocyanin